MSARVTVKLIDDRATYTDVTLIQTDVTTIVILMDGDTKQWVIPWTSILYMRYEDT